MRSIGSALPQTLKSLGIHRRVRAAQVLWLWPQVIGTTLAAETAAVKLTGGVLWVTASSAPLAHQLHLERTRLTEQLNARVGAPVVTDIRFLQSSPRR